MKYLLNISVNINSNLMLENFRGEGRWERNVLNALLLNNRQVHTTRNVWFSQEPRPSNLYNGLNEEWLPDSTLLVHGAGRSLFIERNDARSYMVQFHETPFGEAKEEFLKYLKENRIIATVASWNPFIHNQLASNFGKENIYRMSGAMVPYVDNSADNFRAPFFTWSYRNFRSYIEEKPKDIENLLSFLEPILKNEPETRIQILVGLWDTTRFGTLPEKEDIKDWVFNFPVMKKFSHLHNQIDIHVNIHWNEVLSLLKKTRFIISPAEPLGCPAYEAAMFGIPTIMNQEVNPFMTLNKGALFPELLLSNKNIDHNFLQHLNRLQNDYNFYKITGSAYRRFTEETATFKAYANQLDLINKERGWL